MVELCVGIGSWLKVCSYTTQSAHFFDHSSQTDDLEFERQEQVEAISLFFPGTYIGQKLYQDQLNTQGSHSIGKTIKSNSRQGKHREF